jgi:hypothetical protein
MQRVNKKSRPSLKSDLQPSVFATVLLDVFSGTVVIRIGCGLCRRREPECRGSVREVKNQG